MSVTTKPAALTLAEAVPLCAAWAQQVGRERGIRSLLIKGATMSHHGLRNARVSADVDLLVEPERFDEFCAALAAGGWRDRPLPFISSWVSAHSRTYLRDGWPCDIDVHRHFPGFLADPATVFDELWARVHTLPIAHRGVDVPDRMSSTLILALHSLRDGNVKAAHQVDLSRLLEISFTDSDLADLADLAIATGSAEALSDVLPAIGVHLTTAQRAASAARHDPALLRAWQGRLASRSEGAYVWLLTLRRAPWRERPRLIGRALWPSGRDLRLSHPDVPERLWPILRARVARWGRGIRGLPVSLRALRVFGRR